MAHSKAYRFICLGLLIARAFTQNIIPDIKNFRRVGFWRATVLDNYIYLDGGQASSNSSNRIKDPIKETLSIDCTTSWSPSDILIREIERSSDIPSRSGHAMLTDKTAGSFYIYGGWPVRKDSAGDSQFWRFTADGKGGGDWAREAIANADFFASLQRSAGAAHVSTNEAGFIIGGAVVDLGQNLEVFRVFNFTTTMWEEERTTGYSKTGTLWGASATFIEKYGNSGIIVLLGGLERRNQEAEAMVDPGNVFFYDIAEKTWHTQETAVITGREDEPIPWSNGCVVGIEDTGDNGTFEM